MDIRKIKKMIELLEESGIAEIEIKEGEETLRIAGYVDRDPHDDCYRPTIMVRALSDGFDDEAMVAHIAKPHIAALCAAIVWPIAIATPSGTARTTHASGAVPAR